jgi:putative membrane protein
MKNEIKNLKTAGQLRQLTLGFFTLLLAFSINSCGDNSSKDADDKDAMTTADTNANKMEDSKDSAQKINDANLSNRKESDADFLVNAAEINLEEIKLGQLAQKSGMMADVKSLGKMMETEHKKALKELEGLAAKKQIAIPASLTDKGQDAKKDLLEEKKGKDFDKEYCDKMVSGHKDAISKFEKASKDATDADVRAWAASMLPGLKKHLEHSETCQKKCEKMD